MTDKKDDYYQPWLRHAAPDRAPSPVAPDEGLAKPREVPPVGLDVSRYAAPETPARKPVVTADQVKAGSARLWQALRRGAARFADWTIDLGDRADIPARVEAMEIPRRTREGAGKIAAATTTAASAAGRTSASAARAAARASGAAWDRLALGEKVRKLSNEAGRGLGEVAGKTRAGVGQIARSGSESIKGSLGDAATRLRPAPRGEDTPPSGLEQLLAREEATAQQARPAAADLPLFAGDATLAAATSRAGPDAAPSGEGDDRSPLPPPKARKPAARAMAASPLPQLKGNGMDGGSTRTWIALAAGGALLLAAAFWLGGRTVGGMSKGEVETIVADYIKANPQIIPEALEAQRNGEIAKAIGAIRPALEKPYAGAWAGNADGDVTLVVFTDYACGFCRASVPDVDRLIREDKRLKVVFRELPIIAPQSRDAALMALAAARQGKYDAFHHAMFAVGSLDGAGIAEAARRAGVVTDGSADATANEALFQRELDSNLAIASQLQLNATPTWVVGNQLLQGQIGYDALRQAVAKARAAKS